MSTEADQHFLDYQQTRNPRSLAKVFDLVAGELLLLAGHLAPEPSGAEDLVQSTFLEAIRYAERFEMRTGVRAWLIGIMSNQARMEWRRVRRKLNPVRLDPQRFPHEESTDQDFEVEAREFQRLLREAIAGLPSQYREVVRLALLHGLSLREISQATGCSREAAKSRWKRGIRLLRSALPSGIAFAAVLAMVPSRGLAASRAVILAQAEAEHAGLRALALEGAGQGRGLPWMGLVGIGTILLCGALAGIWPDPDPGAAYQVEIGRPADPAEPELDLSPVVRSSHPLPSADASGTRLVVQVRAADDREPGEMELALRPAGQQTWLCERIFRSDARGRLVIEGLPAGAWRLRGPRGLSRELRLAEGQTRRVELRLQAGVVIRGQCRDKRGAPLQGAELLYLPEGRRSDLALCIGRSDDAGRFCLRDLPERGFLSARHAGRWGPRWYRVDRQSGDWPVLLQFRGATVRIQGQVRDAAQRPLAGVAIMAGHAFDPGTLSQDLHCSRTHSDAQGRFELDGLPPFQALPIWLGSPSAASFRIAFGGQEPGCSARLRVSLARGAALRGNLRDAAGNPVDGAEIRVEPAVLRADLRRLDTGPAWARLRVRSDAAGGFALDRIPPGKVSLLARKGDRRCSWDGTLKEATRTDADLQFRTHPGVRGRVRDRQGHPLAGFLVRSQGAANRPVEETRSDEAGHFFLPLADAAAETLHFYPPADSGLRLRHNRAGVRPQRGLQDFVMPAELVPSCRVRLRLQLDQGAAPGKAALVGIHTQGRAQGKWRQFLPLESGALLSRPIAAGHHRFLIQVQDAGVLDLGSHELRPGQTLDLGEHRMARPARLEVFMKDADGSPSAQSEIYVQRLGSLDATRLQLVAGRGLSRALQPGTWRVALWRPGCGPLLRDIELHAGAHRKLELQLRRGGRPFDLILALPPGRESCTLRCFAGQRLVYAQRTNLQLSAGGHRERLWLRPGRYTLELERLDGRRLREELVLEATTSTVPRVVLKIGKEPLRSR